MNLNERVAQLVGKYNELLVYLETFPSELYVNVQNSIATVEAAGAAVQAGQLTAYYEGFADIFTACEMAVHVLGTVVENPMVVINAAVGSLASGACLEVAAAQLDALLLMMPDFIERRNNGEVEAVVAEITLRLDSINLALGSVGTFITGISDTIVVFLDGLQAALKMVADTINVCANPDLLLMSASLANAVDYAPSASTRVIAMVALGHITKEQAQQRIVSDSGLLDMILQFNADIRLQSALIGVLL